MKNEDKIAELLAESLKRQDQMVEELKQTNGRLYKIETKVDKVEEQLVKLNLQTSENTRAIFTLADKVEQIADLHNRVTKLEKTVFK